MLRRDGNNTYAYTNVLVTGRATAPPPSPRLDNRASPVITGEVTSRSHKRDPEYCLLLEERNPAQKNTNFNIV